MQGAPKVVAFCHLFVFSSIEHGRYATSFAVVSWGSSTGRNNSEIERYRISRILYRIAFVVMKPLEAKLAKLTLIITGQNVLGVFGVYFREKFTHICVSRKLPSYFTNSLRKVKYTTKNSLYPGIAAWSRTSLCLFSRNFRFNLKEISVIRYFNTYASSSSWNSPHTNKTAKIETRLL